MRKRTNSKPAKALDAGNGREPSLNHEPAVAIFEQGRGIAALAKELADLSSLSIAMANVAGSAKRARDAAGKDIDAERHTQCCKAVLRFEAVDRRAYGMVQGLERLICGLEPQTLDEILSLALVLSSRLCVVFANEGSCEEPEMHRLQDALHAIVRGLIAAGANSPLLAKYSNKADLVPWGEARSAATCEAIRYGVVYDPVAGCFKVRETAR